MTGRFTFLLPWLALLFMGAAWGLSFSFAVIATGAGGTPFGITFWQCIVCGGILLGYNLLRGRPMPLSGRHLRIYLYVALLGASIPNSLYYFSAPHVDAGVLSITVTLIPMVTYAVALALGSAAVACPGEWGDLRCHRHPYACPARIASLQRDAIPWLLLACVSAATRWKISICRGPASRISARSEPPAGWISWLPHWYFLSGWQRTGIPADRSLWDTGMDDYRAWDYQRTCLHHFHRRHRHGRTSVRKSDRLCRHPCWRILGYGSVR